jgi:hypothetical protein
VKVIEDDNCSCPVRRPGCGCLRHAGATITLQVYAHVMPGTRRDAAGLFASLVERGKA